MTNNCALDCSLKENCPRKRRVANPEGYCRYQTQILGKQEMKTEVKQL